ncbi:hypothetical protein QOZ80_2AG0123560 [Eleusine coracana subsp. coracana]|nr:hypothetical protein QOZ80_2AG0123560 [Eleusine coracana subsp. coracana]
MAAASNNMFAVTCGLLRQYMTENKHQQSQQQTGGLAGRFLLPPPQEEMEVAEDADARTMQLFPTHADTSQQQQSQNRLKKQATPPVLPLTIFYEGRVLMFEDFPADKAKELMQLRGGGGGSSPTRKNEVPVVPQNPAATEPSSLPTDLPIARKASLKRFLQKRKHRIVTTGPYQNREIPTGKEAAEGKPVNGEPAASWIAL